MESELAEREKERRLKADKLAKEDTLRRERKKRENLEMEVEKERMRQRQTKEQQERLKDEMMTSSSSASSLEKTKFNLGRLNQTMSRISPQTSPRRARHKRQNSDPMIAKFSPIEEDRDFEKELLYRPSSEASRLISSLVNNYSSPQTTRQARKLLCQLSRTLDDVSKRHSNITQAPGYGSLSRSSDILAKLSMLEREARMSSSHSESSLPLTSRYHRSKTPTYFSDDDDVKHKEEKKVHLKLEIGIRKRQLEETKYLQNEIRKLAEMPDISPFEMDRARYMYQQHVRMRDPVPTGIIKPVDYQIHLDASGRPVLRDSRLSYPDDDDEDEMDYGTLRADRSPGQHAPDTGHFYVLMIQNNCLWDSSWSSVRLLTTSVKFVTYTTKLVNQSTKCVTRLTDFVTRLTKCDNM